ncbi:hypothetical protein [Myxococcus hansupus]|uniref:hypothetical protein n=1 Tax=Pseudomyxococcus hansupus TaxID=1297742 RepID=UPI0005D0FEA5|nr:hypothetical protein [Myxococcus hansupus]
MHPLLPPDIRHGGSRDERQPVQAQRAVTHGTAMYPLRPPDMRHGGSRDELQPVQAQRAAII